MRKLTVAVAAWALICVGIGFGVTRGPAKVAVIQPRPLERQDAFMGSFDPARVRPDMEANLENIYRLLKEAGEMGADIVCAPEDMQRIAGFGLHLKTKDPVSGKILFDSLAEPIPGPISRRVSAIAREYGMYAIAPIYELDGGVIYNTSVVIGRQGEIIGKCRKMHLPVLETWGVVSGDDYPVFETDFGLIAIATCWEISYPEVSSIYALKGADIIFNPTLGKENRGTLDTAFRYRTRAKDNSVYVAPVAYGSDGSGIIDFSGRTIAEAVGTADTVIIAEIDFSKDRINKSEWWLHINGTDNVKAMRLLSRHPETYKLICDPRPPVLERYKDVKLTTGKRDKQLEAIELVRYGP